jgi:hypothetical protein
MLAMVMLSGHVLADAAADRMIRERIYSDAASEAARAGQRLYNDGQTHQLRHRVEDQTPAFAAQSQYQHQHRTQQGKQAKHSYQYREQSSGAHKHQSGSRSSRAGKGGKGGGGRGR